MKVLVTTVLFLFFSTYSLSARETFPQTKRACLTKLSDLGSLIRKHNPDEEHMSQLRKKARTMAGYCQSERFGRAQRLYQQLKRSITSVNNASTGIVPAQDRKSSIAKCIKKLSSVGPKVMAKKPNAAQNRHLKSLGQRMHKNCRLRKFSRAESDYKKILSYLEDMGQDIAAGDFGTRRSCHRSARNLYTRLSRTRPGRQKLREIRRSVKGVSLLCRKNKLSQAKAQFKTIETRYASLLEEDKADRPAPVSTSRNDRKNQAYCRRAHTYLFNMINKKSMSSRQRRKFLRQRKTFGDYCFEKDYPRAKKLFRNLKTQLDKKDNKESNTSGRATATLSSADTITAENCRSKVRQFRNRLEDQSLSGRQITRAKRYINGTQKLCRRNRIERANSLYQRALSSAQLGKTGLPRRPSRQNSRSGNDGDQKQACKDKLRPLYKRIKKEAQGFRNKISLRRKWARMRSLCNSGKFDKAMAINQQIEQRLDDQ